MFLKMSKNYVKSFDKSKKMHFQRKDDELLDKYNIIWEKASKSIKKRI